MSKIGRKPINIGNIQVEIKGNEIHYKGKKNSGIYVLPEELTATVEDKSLKIVANKDIADINRIWGLHRALISNKLKGSDNPFEKQLKIVGLGFKGALSGNKIQFSLGYSHKIDFELPKDVVVEIDKTGQLLTVKCSDKEVLGHVCSSIRSLRPPEPYKGTGIQYMNEVIIRKAGKTKSA
ncbi:50S ribosomal protein L6 [Candidatus Dependentiae bacterium]|nr:50S ribosomal protein L6 [Candidatus Dependentiae bacterium]